MEGCLLCLEINKELVGSINVNSIQWQKLNIKHIIEKHLWMMETLLPSSWLCHACWQTLYDFHKFYIRIEEAHSDFGQVIKPKVVGKSKDEKKVSIPEDYENDEDIKDLFDTHLEPEVLIDQLLMEDKGVIKVELNEDQDEDIPLITRRLKSKDNNKCRDETKTDPLKNLIKAKKTSKCKISKKDLYIQSNTSGIEPNPEIEIQEMKPDLDILVTQDISHNSPNSSDSDDIDTYSDYEYKPEKETKPKQKAKKKCLRKINSSDSNDSTLDSDKKPKTYDKKRHKQTSKQNDLFLSENFKMSCALCQIPIENFKILVKHFEIEHKVRGYAVCCNKKFYQRVMLVEHVQRHVYPSNFKCEQCGKELSSQKTLKSHQLLHASEEEKKFACSECAKTYADQNLLSIHINQVHLKKYVRICDICGKRVGCGEVFLRHMLEHEGKSLPTIRCDVCGLHVSSKHGLGRHKRMQHPVGGKKDYICNMCQKVSPNIHALRQHIRVIHNTSNLHKCTMCERVFKKPLALKEHLATHTGIALYTCPWCPKTFNANGGMHAHRKRQHPIEWEESRRQKKLERYKTELNSNVGGLE